jgi:SAM-dependent methyltransferase
LKFKRVRDGSSGWDEYARFYDWENARTLGRQDLAFWRTLAQQTDGPILELGCGTGRLLVPLARAGAGMTGVDRSAPMLARAIARARRLSPARRPAIARGDIRALPFASQSFRLVMAPYGMLQSMLTDGDLAAVLRESARVLQPGGRVGIDLVPDLARWPVYRSQLKFRGRATGGSTVTLIESVRHDRRRHFTIFDEHFTERHGPRRRERRFSLIFRTLPMAAMRRRIERAGFRIDAMLGDYRGRAWDTRADVWLILATKT